jgi:CheY-like chemotaxis protein
MATSNQERILLVDPNPLFLERLAHGLRAMNFDVVATGSGEQAFHVLRDWHHPGRLALQPCQSAGPDRWMDFGR